MCVRGLSATIACVLNCIVVRLKKKTKQKNNSHLVDCYLRITKRNYIRGLGGGVNLKPFSIQQSSINWVLLDTFPSFSCLGAINLKAKINCHGKTFQKSVFFWQILKKKLLNTFSNFFFFIWKYNPFVMAVSAGHAFGIHDRFNF